MNTKKPKGGAAARIAALEAENAELRTRYDVVMTEVTKMRGHMGKAERLMKAAKALTNIMVGRIGEAERLLRHVRTEKHPTAQQVMDWQDDCDKWLAAKSLLSTHNPLPQGVPHPGCNYLGTPGTVCNKCGQLVEFENMACGRCGKPIRYGRGGCEGAQHGNIGCALNNPKVT